MTPGAKILVAAIGLGVVHIVAARQGSNLQRGFRWGAGARDTPGAPLTGIPGRLERANRNFAEMFPLFAAAVFLAAQQGVSNAVTFISAYAYLGARILYLLLYMLGVSIRRSLASTIATLGIFTLLWGSSNHKFAYRRVSEAGGKKATPRAERNVG